jgi:AraC family transcriptional regulator of adaptative response / DNA-3-methyladenine glycosylase II
MIALAPATGHASAPSCDTWHRACDERDPDFDGIFFVAITSTRIFCRPICPSRRARPENRRFFLSAAAAQRAGFRPCLRCRPDLVRGRAPVDAVERLARAAARRISAGALNGRGVKALAAELGVSDRQLRRAVERVLGVSPRDLAQTHRLSHAKRLLTDTDETMIQIAYTSGFQSLRRFNAAFREQYRMSPGDVRRSQRDHASGMSSG